jgi:hypothetical protein
VREAKDRGWQLDHRDNAFGDISERELSEAMSSQGGSGEPPLALLQRSEENNSNCNNSNRSRELMQQLAQQQNQNTSQKRKPLQHPLFEDDSYQDYRHIADELRSEEIEDCHAGISNELLTRINSGLRSTRRRENPDRKASCPIPVQYSTGLHTVFLNRNLRFNKLTNYQQTNNQNK